MLKDKLFILKVDFEDPAYPDARFFCWHCVLMEGLLASYPQLASRIDVERIAWPRPRSELIDLVGPDNQTLPLLVLADDAPEGLETGRYGSRRFVDHKDAILRVLSVRHDVASPHP